MPKPHSREWYEGRMQLLQYLDSVALKTEGAGVWRGLFGEAWRVHKLELAALEREAKKCPTSVTP